MDFNIFKVGWLPKPSPPLTDLRGGVPKGGHLPPLTPEAKVSPYREALKGGILGGCRSRSGLLR